MSVNRLPDYLGHIRQAAADACSFIDDLSKEDFLTDKRAQNAVVMCLIVIGEAATKVMDRSLTLPIKIQTFRGEVCAECAIVLRMATLKSISM